MKIQIVFTAEQFSAVDVLTNISNLKIVRRWAYVMHPHTELRRTSPHYHLFLELFYPVEKATLAAIFGVSSNVITDVVSTKCFLKYLSIGVSPEEVVANFDYLKAIGRKYSPALSGVRKCT